MPMHQGRRSKLLNIRLADWQRGRLFQALYVCVLSEARGCYLTILCTDLLIITTVAGKWLNNLIFHNILQLMDRQLFIQFGGIPVLVVE